MTRRFWGLLCCGLMFVAAAAEAQTDDSHKSDLKVLFVGQDPARPFVNYEPTKRTTNLIKERTGAFAAFLRKHFEQVRVVHVEDYDPGMSASADVTVFDANPPKPLGQDFRHASLMIAEVSPQIGEPLGLKLDWL